MSATENSDQIDLNSDFVSVDRENEVHGDGVSGSTIRVGVSEAETVMESLDGQDSALDKIKDFQGPSEGLDEHEAVTSELGNDRLEGAVESVDRVSNLELLMGFVNRGVNEERGNVSTMPEMDGEDRDVKVPDCGVALSDGKSDRAVENAGEDVEGEIISVINGDHSTGCGPGFRQGEDISLQVDEAPGVTVCVSHLPDETPVIEATVGDADGSVPNQDLDLKLNPNVSVVVTSDILQNQTMEDNMEVETEDNLGTAIDVPEAGVASVPSHDADVSANVSVVVTSEVLEDQTTEDNVEAKTEDDQRADVDSPEAGVSQSTGNEFNAFNLVVDLNSCMNREGNSKSADWIGSEGTQVKDISMGEAAGHHANGDVCSGNQDVTSEEHVKDPGWLKHYGKKKNRKLAAAKSCVSDLVWGKVRSHPWWPGQIFDPSAATKKAKKYYKKDSFLIAYFGDQTFAWNDASSIKPFSAHFSQMVKQSNSEDFCYALDCALDEVSRRVEFGLACSCLPENLVASIKSQIIVNAGIREESSRRDGGDGFLGVDSFEPTKLIQYIKALAADPYCGVDRRLEHVISQAQLLAFHRSKGYSELPEFKILGGLLEEDEEFILPGNRENSDEMREVKISDIKDEKQVPSAKEKLNSLNDSSCKRKHISSDDTNPGKKEKSLSDLMAGKRCNASNGDGILGKKVGPKLISSSSSKKRKAVDPMPDDSPIKLGKSDLSTSGGTKSQSKQTFRVGESILRVANQLNGAAPLLKYRDGSDGTSQNSVLKNRSKEKPARDSVVSPCSPKNSEESPNRKFIPTEYCAPDEMLSRLWLAAKDPMKGYSFTISVVSFFSEFRNSFSLDPADFGRMSEDAEGSELEYMEDAYLSNRIVQSIPEEQMSLGNPNEPGQLMPEIPSEKVIPAADLQASLISIPNMDTEQQFGGGTQELEAVKPVDHLAGGEPSQTALILNFTDFDSIPSITNLNRIYSQFGPLNEAATEVRKKSSRAKVVFRRRSDAETAFSSAGKYKIFGPSLVSYSLKYLPSTPSKASPHAKKRAKKDETSE